MNDFNYSPTSVTFGTTPQGTATVTQREEEQQDVAGERSQIQKSVRVRAFWQISLVGIQEINYIELNMSKSIRWDMLKQESKKNKFRKVREGQTTTNLSLSPSVLVFLCIYFDQKSLRGFRQRKNNFQGKKYTKAGDHFPNYRFGSTKLHIFTYTLR